MPQYVINTTLVIAKVSSGEQDVRVRYLTTLPQAREPHQFRADLWGYLPTNTWRAHDQRKSIARQYDLIFDADNLNLSGPGCVFT